MLLVLKDRTTQSGISPGMSEWGRRGDKRMLGSRKTEGGIKRVYCKDEEATEGKKRARENLCTQKHHYITRSKRYATLRHLAAPLSVQYNVTTISVVLALSFERCRQFQPCDIRTTTRMMSLLSCVKYSRPLSCMSKTIREMLVQY